MLLEFQRLPNNPEEDIFGSLVTVSIQSNMSMLKVNLPYLVLKDSIIPIWEFMKASQNDPWAKPHYLLRIPTCSLGPGAAFCEAPTISAAANSPPSSRDSHRVLILSSPQKGFRVRA